MTGAEQRHFVVIGAMKCATTSIHESLASHPGIAVPRRKELDFFSDPSSPDDPRRRREAYARLFRGCEAEVVGESSPSYTMLSPEAGVAARIAATIPHARLVYCLRDPVERMRSHYRHEVLRSRERRPAPEALGDATYLTPSLYGRQLRAYLEHFPADQVAVVSAHDLLDDPASVLDPLFRFLGLDPAAGGSVVPAFESDKRPAFGSLTERLRSVPGARAVLGLVPSGAKSRVAAALPGARRAADTSRALFATAPGWQPDDDQVRALEDDARLLDDALAGCLVLGRVGWPTASPGA